MQQDCEEARGVGQAAGSSNPDPGTSQLEAMQAAPGRCVGRWERGPCSSGAAVLPTVALQSSPCCVHGPEPLGQSSPAWMACLSLSTPRPGDARTTPEAPRGKAQGQVPRGDHRRADRAPDLLCSRHCTLS